VPDNGEAYCAEDVPGKQTAQAVDDAEEDDGHRENHLTDEVYFC